jgi:hypothetical protein
MILAATAALTVSCEADIAKVENGVEPENKSGESGDAQEGKLSIDAPGFEMKIDLPKLREYADVQASGESDILYPGSQLGAMHIDAQNEQGRVDLRFTSPDGIDKVAGWYSDPARSKDFEIGASRRDGAAYLIEGKDKDGDGRFQLRLEAAQGGGTAGQLLLTGS